MTTSEAYRLYAADCMKLAETVADPDIHARLVAMALKWRELADEAEAARRLNLTTLSNH